MGALLEASLAVAAYRVFAPSWNMPMVIEFVALVRNDYAGASLPFTARDAERELRRALGDTVPPPGDAQAAGIAQMCLLRVLKDVLELDDDGLTELLAEARLVADRALARATAQPPATEANVVASRPGANAGVAEPKKEQSAADPVQVPDPPDWKTMRAVVESIRAENRELKQRLQDLKAEHEATAARVDALEARLRPAARSGSGD